MQSQDLRLARKVIGMSKTFNERLKEDYQLYRAKFGVVYQPIALDQISACKRQADGQVRLLFVGRISVRKGIELLLEAAPHILSKHLNATITPLGEDSRRIARPQHSSPIMRVPFGVHHVLPLGNRLRFRWLVAPRFPRR